MKSYNEIIMDHMISQGITLNDIFNCYSNQIVPSGDDSAKAYANIKAIADDETADEHTRQIASYAYPYFGFLASNSIGNKKQFKDFKTVSGIIDNIKHTISDEGSEAPSYMKIWRELHPKPYDDIFSPYYKDEEYKDVVFERNCDVLDKYIAGIYA